MNKNIVAIWFPGLLFVLLAACGPVLPGGESFSNEQSSTPISTENKIVLTKFAGLTGEAETQTAVSPKNGATVAAILMTKFAGATKMAETMTAEPTATTTPTIPSDSPFCKSSDLKPFSASNGATGNILLSVVLTDVSSKPCYLQTWPQAILLDEHGDPLDVDYHYQDRSASDSASAQTEKVGLWPGWEAKFDLLWFDDRTWCGKPITGNLVIQLQLRNDGRTLKIPTDFRPGTACDTPESRTSVSVSKIYVGPPPGG